MKIRVKNPVVDVWTTVPGWHGAKQEYVDLDCERWIRENGTREAGRENGKQEFPRSKSRSVMNGPIETENFPLPRAALVATPFRIKSQGTAPSAVPRFRTPQPPVLWWRRYRRSAD